MDNVKELLIKKAKGYYYDEITEERAIVNDQLIMVRQKIKTKHIPPDTTAVKLLMGQNQTNLDLLDLEGLTLEKNKLLKELENYEN